ncbi:MAG: class II aldolase/adducin family protein [Lautropia sp.]
MTGGPASRYRCEDDARAALSDGLRRLRRAGLGGMTALAALRWARSGSDGLLLAVGPPPGRGDRDGDHDPGDGSPVDDSPDDSVWVAMSSDRRIAGAATAATTATATTTAAALPTRLFRLRPQAAAMLLLDAPHATALACVGRIQRDGIPPLLADVWLAGGRTIRCAVGGDAGIAAALVDRDACLVANRGLLAIGADLAAAAALARRVETIAAVYWRALQVGDTVALLDSPGE